MNRTSLSIAAVVLLLSQPAIHSQSGSPGIAGRWRGVVVTAYGGTQDISLNLEVKGGDQDGVVTGVAFGLPATGRVEGATVTLSIAVPGRPPAANPVLTGQMVGDQIV